MFARIRTVLLVFLGISTAVIHAQSYRLTILQPLVGYTGCYVYGVDEFGIAAGYSYRHSPYEAHATIWLGGVAYDLNPADATSSFFNAIVHACAVGSVRWVPGAGPVGQPLVFAEGEHFFVSNPDGFREAVFNDANQNGVAVGASGRREEPNYVFTPTVWKGEETIFIERLLGTISGNARAVNNRNEVVGECMASPSSYHAFLWREREGLTRHLPPLEGDSQSLANDINDFGQIVGSSFTNSGGFQAVMWEDEQPTSLGTFPGAVSTSATSLNNLRVTVGTARANTGISLGFRWKPAEGMVPLSSLVTNLGDFKIVGPTKINNRGQIVGYGYERTFGGPTRGFLLTPAGRPTIDLDVISVLPKNIVSTLLQRITFRL